MLLLGGSPLLIGGSLGRRGGSPTPAPSATKRPGVAMNVAPHHDWTVTPFLNWAKNLRAIKEDDAGKAWSSHWTDVQAGNIGYDG